MFLKLILLRKYVSLKISYCLTEQENTPWEGLLWKNAAHWEPQTWLVDGLRSAREERKG